MKILRINRAFMYINIILQTISEHCQFCDQFQIWVVCCFSLFKFHYAFLQNKEESAYTNSTNLREIYCSIRYVTLMHKIISEHRCFGPRSGQCSKPLVVPYNIQTTITKKGERVGCYKRWKNT